MTRIDQMKRLPVQFLAALSATGCATLFNDDVTSVGIYSSPAEAEVWIGDTLVGRTPLSLEVDNQKSHFVRLRKEGHSAGFCRLDPKFQGQWLLLDLFPGLIVPFFIPLVVDLVSAESQGIGEEACNIILNPASGSPSWSGQTAARPAPQPPQNVGGRVRVTTSSGILIGRTVQSGRDGIDLALDGFGLAELEGPYWTVPHSEILRMEMSRGRKGNWELGFLSGLGGMLLGVAIPNFCIGTGCGTHPDTGLFAVLGALAGGGLGLAVGRSTNRGEQWEPIRHIGADSTRHPAGNPAGVSP